MSLVEDISVLKFFGDELLKPDVSGRAFLEAFTNYRTLQQPRARQPYLNQVLCCCLA